MAAHVDQIPNALLSGLLSARDRLGSLPPERWAGSHAVWVIRSALGGRKVTFIRSLGRRLEVLMSATRWYPGLNYLPIKTRLAATRGLN
jgi:hypothetical protein